MSSVSDYHLLVADLFESQKFPSSAEFERGVAENLSENKMDLNLSELDYALLSLSGVISELNRLMIDFPDYLYDEVKPMRNILEETYLRLRRNKLDP